MNKLHSLCLLLVCASSFSQEKNLTFPSYGGNEFETFQSYIVNNFKIPDWVLMHKPRGKIVLEFSITDKGYIDSISIWNCVHKELEKEAIRILKETDGRWTPATKDGKPVGVKILCPFITIDTEESIYSYEEEYKIFFEKAEDNFLKENYKNALKYYLKCVNLEPMLKENYFKISICYKNLGDLKMSESYKKKSERLSDFPEIR